MCLAVPMKVIELIPPDRANVEAEGISTVISTRLVENVSVGDYVIVHTGFALEVLDVEEAEETLKLLKDMAKAGE
ncbi:HypC/HybG/HupF family hydrogenase formation chaperone [Candidatus Omnitrophota bacterium]